MKKNKANNYKINTLFTFGILKVKLNKNKLNNMDLQPGPMTEAF